MIVTCGLFAAEPAVLILAKLAGHVIAAFVLLCRRMAFWAFGDLKARRSVLFLDLLTLQASRLKAEESFRPMIGLSAFEAHLGTALGTAHCRDLGVGSLDPASTAWIDAPSD